MIGRLSVTFQRVVGVFPLLTTLLASSMHFAAAEGLDGFAERLDGFNVIGMAEHPFGVLRRRRRWHGPNESARRQSQLFHFCGSRVRRISTSSAARTCPTKPCAPPYGKPTGRASPSS